MIAEIGKRYRHYKNKKEYVVLSIGVHTETLEKMVVYQGQYTDPEFGVCPLWIRPLELFESDVEVDGILVPRFKKV